METSGEVFRRENGMDFKRVFENGVDPPSLDDEAAKTRVDAFAERLRPLLKLNGEPAWAESIDAPYQTVQITQTGFDALVLWAAHQHRPI